MDFDSKSLLFLGLIIFISGCTGTTETTMPVSTTTTQATTSTTIASVSTSTTIPVETNEITFSDINQLYTVSDFKYVPIICNFGDCEEEFDGVAITQISGYDGISKSYSFKLTFSPADNKPIYFQPYTTDTNNGIAAAKVVELEAGDTIVYMTSSDVRLTDDLVINLCFSYVDFSVSNNQGSPIFIKNGPSYEELNENEYTCSKKIFENPQIDVNINPTTVQIDVTSQTPYGESDIMITNTGDAPIDFYFWAPNQNDGSGNLDYSCAWGNEGSMFLLKPDEIKQITVTCNLFNSAQSPYSIQAYVYALRSSECGTQTMPLNNKGCPDNAIFKKSLPITLKQV